MALSLLPSSLPSMELIQRARDSGRFVPTLVSDEHVIDNDGFGADLLKLLDGNSFHLAPEKSIGDGFVELLKKADTSGLLTLGSDEGSNKRTLELRRCLLLAVAGGTPPESPSLTQALAKGYLDSVKRWLDDILAGTVGSVDLLLHLLSNIVQLPVTKDVVKVSGMGKVIGQIEKHRMCVGTPNETAIMDRIQQVKDAWNASVKQRKSQESASSPPSSAGVKRLAEHQPPSPSTAKKVKTSTDDSSGRKSSSFSSLVKRASGSEGKHSVQHSTETDAAVKAVKQKKVSKRVKWADHFGNELTSAQLIEIGDGAEVAPSSDTSVSWSDRKKRDRMREKELLSKVKKAKLLDDDDDGDVPISQPKVQVRMAWHAPAILPDRPDAAKPQLSSNEVATLSQRLSTISKAVYHSEYDVPSSPAPLSDVEQALDMTSQSSAVIQSIPFFVPQTAPTPAVAATGFAPSLGPSPPQVNAAPFAAQPQPYPPGNIAGATPEFVQALGLPLFLVGQDTKALQTLASSPGLLNTMVDHNGMYDQARLLTLVQTLSATNSSQPLATQPTPVSSYQPSAQGMYGQTVVAPVPAFGQPTSLFAGTNGFRSSSSDGNLHISGYGPNTTEQDIINLFAPYVVVNEVCMKGNFAFVNTNDPANAQRAREALTGSLVGGMPVRINPAQRKAKENPISSSTYGVTTAPGPVAPNSFTPTGVGLAHNPMPSVNPIPQARPGLPSMAAVDAVRDDRGNAATKNLFVAGYGPGTTEQQIRELFSQHCAVIGVVLKGSFTFVNTAERADAVAAREALSGAIVNGGSLRINFAKETGRLGTSFDLTYGPNTGPNARRTGPPPPPMSYYGRG